MECSGTYTVEQTDMDSGVLENAFTVSASSPDLPDEPDIGASDSTTVALPGTALAIVGEPPIRRLLGVEKYAFLFRGRTLVLQLLLPSRVAVKGNPSLQHSLIG